MINDAPLKSFAPLAGGLVKPNYAGYSFANISPTIEYLLTGDARGPLLPPDCFGGTTYPTPQKIVTIFIDSFGWQFWQQHHHHYRATRRVIDRGTLTPISALFPSTTSASVSTLHLGVLPAEHALHEWNVYIPAYGEVIQSLAFAPLGTRAQDACLKKGYDPAKMLEVHETTHQRLGRHGVRSLQFANRAYARSAYNRIVTAGAEVIQHSTLAEGLVQLKEALLATPGKACFGFYWAAIDTIAHMHGPGSATHEAEIASFWHTFDAIFQDVRSAETLYLFTADHGHVYADAKSTYNINERIPALADCLSVSPSGNTIWPNGSPRDVFLHVRPERRTQALDLLSHHLNEIAFVLPVDEALWHGLFGPRTVSPELRRRLGDILILPYLGHFVWWREPGLLENRFYGHHGGLSPEEVITVFGVVDAL